MIDKLKFYPLKYINSIANRLTNDYICGPFVGEFGWELVFWHRWLRKIKKIYTQIAFYCFIFSCRKPLYEFADEFINLPDFYVNNKFSERDYFIDWEIYQDDKKKDI